MIEKHQGLSKNRLEALRSTAVHPLVCRSVRRSATHSFSTSKIHPRWSGKIEDRMKTDYLKLSRVPPFMGQSICPSVGRPVGASVCQSITLFFRTFEICSRLSRKIEDQEKTDFRLSRGPQIIPISRIICPISRRKSDGLIVVPTGTCFIDAPQK